MSLEEIERLYTNMKSISELFGDPKDQKVAAELEHAIGYASWCGSSTCGINIGTARYLFAVLVAKEKKKYDGT